MTYSDSAIPEAKIPGARAAGYQHAIDIYAGETNKTISVWRQMTDADLAYRPHVKSSSVLELFKHQLLSERRFFGEFLASPEPPPAAVLPVEITVESACLRLVELALPRLDYLAAQVPEWWIESVPFFGVERSRVWIFWRRVLHSAHHRTQLSVYLRLLDKPVPSTYGPTADVSWTGATPTNSVEAAGRK